MGHLLPRSNAARRDAALTAMYRDVKLRTLALATAGLLALQSIGLYNAGHLYGQDMLLPQLARLLVGAALVGLAYSGWDRTQS